MYVRALYDYDADDRTSLSFRQGDIIQVITQLESGWWDGVVNEVRGWFPSNYCAVVSRLPMDFVDEHGHADGGDDGDIDEETREEFSEDGYDDAESDGNLKDRDTTLPIEGGDDKDQEEAAFWIPQATPDGRLFYYNTLTGVSTMELPLENPTSSSETGPRDRHHVQIPDQTRPPPELMAGGYERAEDDADYENSASEAEEMAHHGRKGSSFATEELSPSASTDSLRHPAMANRTRNDFNLPHNSSFSVVQSAMPPIGTSNSFINSPAAPETLPAIPRKLFDDSYAIPLTWNKMLEDMRRAIERYRQAINNSDRAEFVKRAEDISDHLRLLLVAGSGTTDNHSGNPSIISTNKALYPHFRVTMSRFSKLVLSSHIAAADWPPPDSYAKCLKEAEGVLNGVYGFVEVARQQRGEDIPRLIPGFVSNSHIGGNWQQHGLSPRDSSVTTLFGDSEEYDPSVEPSTRLDGKLLERLEDLRKIFVSNLRRLDEALSVREMTVSPTRHQVIGDNVCRAGLKVLESCRPWLSTVESINLSPLHQERRQHEFMELNVAKQRVYDSTSELLMACQAVASPLGDEWSESRGDSLENRLLYVRSSSKDLEMSMSHLTLQLQRLSELIPMADQPNRDIRVGEPSGFDNAAQSQSRMGQRPSIAELGPSMTYGDAMDYVDTMRNGNKDKLERILGEKPPPNVGGPPPEDVPDFLRLDYERDIVYDTKVTPPQLRGGTLQGLVEQLTRHDRLDSPFNATFLLTYRSFTTATELFEMLMKRWTIQPPFGISNEDQQTWIDKKQRPIRFRVVNILKSWFDTYWMESNDDEARALTQRAYQFASEEVVKTNTPGAGPLMASIDQRMRGQEIPNKKMVLTLNAQTPQPIIPKNMKKLKFLDIDPTEFARQLTIIESRLYGKIKPTECLSKTLHKKIEAGENDPAPNVKALILHSNQLTNWVAQMILNQQDVRRRVIVIKHFVNIADKCRSLNNFSMLTSIISALGTAPIHRLQRTWQSVSAKTMQTLESMRKTMGSTKNFAEYRETLHRANPPCIPFFGVYLTDLTFIEDGIPSTIKKTNLINFAKRAKTAEVIRDIQDYQNVPYALQPVPELQEYILNNMETAGDVHEMYERSLVVEPREREDEKIARYVGSSMPAFAI
ncbi:guanine-nucleotide dissociation stimulator CDC25 [Eremomyces bilateralis CBS 781.70]|uniref:Class E vacuolar protein-sorting machinery protein HSE1 n=1 Tax=Eremomyces bilateralis CBS 781.70 TaxID=1392243 RepID=A0A6G1GBD6_9PEZI|nr:guanine-nucleotide dissociation stimulator CDC25 [Eremomyces bilateralis CBS 781.70]KAF1815220.1 guanine-nucleotide dissociation stimulator CDC25 [Eremomyces bilateralis CBS 781.70]